MREIVDFLAPDNVAWGGSLKLMIATKKRSQCKFKFALKISIFAVQEITEFDPFVFTEMSERLLFYESSGIFWTQLLKAAVLWPQSRISRPTKGKTSPPMYFKYTVSDHKEGGMKFQLAALRKGMKRVYDLIVELDRMPMRNLRGDFYEEKTTEPKVRRLNKVRVEDLRPRKPDEQ